MVAACSSGKCPRVLIALRIWRCSASMRVGGVDGVAQRVGQRQERDDVLPVGPPGLRDHRVWAAPGGVEASRARRARRRRWRRCRSGRSAAATRLAVAVVDVAQRGADLMHDAGLHPGLREDGLDRLREPVRPSTQQIRMSWTPRRCRSLRTASQNFAPSVSCHQIPSVSRSPSQVTPTAR